MKEFGSRINTTDIDDAANGHPVTVITELGKETDPEDSAAALKFVGRAASAASNGKCELAVSGDCRAMVLTRSYGDGNRLAKTDIYQVNCSGAQECPMGYPQYDAPQLPELPDDLM